MKPVILPNLPTGRAALVIVDGRVSPAVCDSLASLKIGFLRTSPLPGLYEAVAWHPDMQLHHVGNGRIVHAWKNPPMMNNSSPAR